MSKLRKILNASALFVIFCSGLYYLLAVEHLWLASSNYSVRYGGDDAYDSQIYQSINGRFYVYLVGKNSLRAIFLIDKTNHKVGYGNDYLNKFLLFGFTLDSFPVSYDISPSNEKTGFDSKLDIQPSSIQFFQSPEDITANKPIVIQFYDN